MRSFSQTLLVGNELKQASIGVAEVHVLTASPCPCLAFCRACDDRHAATSEMFHRRLDRSRPDEAKVAVARFDWPLSVQPDEIGSVDV
jgi:hypothetical protein